MSETDGFTPRTELAQRAQHLRVHLSDLGLDGALIVQKADLFYFSGSIQQAHLYIPVDGDPLLMVRKSVDRARAESAIDKVIPVDSPARLPAILRDNGLRPPRRMGMELDVLPANLFLAYGNIFDTTRIVDVSPAIRTVRSVKSDVEIRQIRKAAECADRVAGAVGGCLAEGMTEIQLAGRIEAVARALGHQGIVRMRLWGNELFYGHLMSGASGAEPSYLASPTGGTGLGPAVAQGPGFKRIRRHEPVLVDYVFAHQGYLADHTRIFSLGALPDALMAAHQVMLAVQEQIQAAGRPGVRVSDLYDIALQTAADHGYGDHFMGVGKNRVRFVGHGIGLELDEVPFLAQGQNTRLEQGMTLAVEPKLIFPGRGVVGIENTHLVTDRGLSRLTRYPDGIQTIG